VIGKRIRYFRKRKNLTQKELGELIGISNRNADVRIAQYESESRIPKRETINKLAEVLEISPYALRVPDLDTPLGIIHTSFLQEDLWEQGLKLPVAYPDIHRMLYDCEKQMQRLKDGEITKEEYDNWRYNYEGEEV